MSKSAWICAACQAVNAVTGHFCEACGEARGTPTERLNASDSVAYVPPWRRPGWKESRPEDRCEGGEDCTLEGEHTIRDHIEAFKWAGERMLTRVVRL